MFLRDDPDPSSDRHARMPELLEDFKTRRMRLMSQARELERLRHQVRASAEREAAAIVTTARHNVRQVLLDARRELLVLVAQLQAVGCDEPADPAKYVVQGQATASSVIGEAAADGVPEAGGASAIVSGARRDVREVLVEAQTELLALAEEARELRARIARQHGGALESAPAEDGGADTAEPAAAAEEHAAQPDAEAAPVEYTPIASTSRVWIPIAAAIAFASVGLALIFGMGRQSSSDAATAQSAASDRPQAVGDAAVHPASSPVVPPAAAPDPAAVAIAIEVRGPAWIRTTIDGRADGGRLYNPGDRRALTANEEIILRAGDAGAVLVSLNGSEAAPLGRDGQVVTRRFGKRAAPATVRPAVAQASVATASPASGSAEVTSIDVGTTGTGDTRTAPPDVLAEREILRATQLWFEAYFAGNAQGMKDVAAPDFTMVDERAEAQRLPATMRGVDRGLQQVRIEVARDGAVMSARLTERATVDGQLREYVSLVSGVWIRSEGRWRLTAVRFIDLAGARPVY